MFGTELDTAYFNTQPTKMNHNDTLPHIIKQEETETINEPPRYEQQIPIVPIFQQNDNVIKELQSELEKQKNLNKKEYSEPLYDRFISKKKDVMKLFNIALTVLLAISLHFVISDLIKSYLQNNDFTYNKEIYIKFMYPLSVLMVLWSFKVFNK
tara:strand:+ start:2594 stop:3055 length:462 start_codon:yes stop_codon:yes gene_type:complete